jgi:hypothetical protein
MRMPGFTAAASLPWMSGDYKLERASDDGIDGQMVIPQRWGCFPVSPCLPYLNKMLYCCIIGGCFWRDC